MTFDVHVRPPLQVPGGAKIEWIEGVRAASCKSAIASLPYRHELHHPTVWWRARAYHMTPTGQRLLGRALVIAHEHPSSDARVDCSRSAGAGDLW